MFTGYALNAGRSWTVDLLAVDAEDLNNLRAFEIPVKRLKSKEVEARTLHD